MEWHDIFPTNMHVKLHHLWKKWGSVTPSGNTLRRHQCGKQTRDVEAAISSTASASTPIVSASTASASSRTWTLTEPELYLIYELADKHDYQNQQLTIYKGTLLVKMIA